MNERDFYFWLKGYIGYQESDILNLVQVKTIKEKINDVVLFTEKLNDTKGPQLLTSNSPTAVTNHFVFPEDLTVEEKKEAYDISQLHNLHMNDTIIKRSRFLQEKSRLHRQYVDFTTKEK